MYFRDLVGNSAKAAQLRDLVRTGRLPHATILQGAAGGGALPLAVATARYLICLNRTETDSCGSCTACRKSEKYVHPDLHFAFPTVGTRMVSDNFLPQWRTALAETPYQDVNAWLQRIGAENKQGNITKEECDAIVRKLSLMTFESTYKVSLIWLPEYLGNEGNRLLKLIEEPPDNTHFLLVTENTELILNTILSRCQLIVVPPPEDEAIAASLTAVGVGGERAATLARLADGNVYDARRMADGTDSDDDSSELLRDWIRICYQGSPVKLVAWTDDFSKRGRESQKYFLRYALYFWRELLTLKYVGNANGTVRLRPAELDAADKLGKLVELDAIGDITGILNDCIRYVERNANPKIVFLDAGIRIHRVLRYPTATAAVESSRA